MSDLHIYDELPQGTPEWHRARMGIPTASMFQTVQAKGKGGAESKTRRDYLFKLAGERITGEPMENFSSPYFDRGHALEPEARKLYEFAHDAQTTQVGFIRNGAKGCSPDSLIGETGMLEIKTKKPDLLIDVLLKDEFPSEHVAQCQGALWVAEREWIDIVCWFPRMPLFVKRATRDENYIKTLSDAVDRFNDELDALVETIKKYGVAA